MCWTVVAMDYELSHKNTKKGAAGSKGNCCAYGGDGKCSCSFPHLRSPMKIKTVMRYLIFNGLLIKAK